MTDTPIADLIERMLAAGLPHPSVVDTVRAIEFMASRDATVTRHAPSRSKEAIRAAKYRKKRKHNQDLAKANDVANTVIEKRDASRDGVTERSNLAVLSSFSSSVLEEETEKKKTRAVVVEGRKRGIRLPPDWQPDETLRQFARDHNVDPDQLRAEFVDFWIAIPGQRGCKTADRGWPATWRNRVRQIQTYRKEKNGQGRPRTVQQAAADQLERLRAINQPAPTLELQPGIRDGEGPPHVRLLSSR